VVAVKAHQAQKFLAAIEPRITSVLLYGSDSGLVLERAQRLSKQLAEHDNPPGEVLRIDDSDLEENPDRLAIELQTIPMFGGRKIVRAATGRRVNAAALKPLIESPNLAGFLIVEAGNLRPDDSLRSAFEKSPAAAAVACYGDEARDLDGLVTESLGAAGLQITADARELLIARLGADRALSRNEVEKLALYAAGKGTIDADDVDAIVGDASELAIERILSSAALGQAQRAVAECSRAISSGESAQGILVLMQRHFHRLHRVRALVDRGGSLDQALGQLRPPLHFKQKDAFAAQCRMWTSARLADAMGHIATTAKAARRTGDLDEMLLERLLLRLAVLARGGGAYGKEPPLLRR
jgi:DNA polymerase-3 subunit delta